MCECPLVVSAGMNMPLHQISVIPRDVTSSRVCGNGKAKDKDKQVRGDFLRFANGCARTKTCFSPEDVEYACRVPSVSS